MTVEIVILAMIAAFLGLRLYSVLGRRAEHEEEPIQGRFDSPAGSGENAPRVPAPSLDDDPRAAGARPAPGQFPSATPAAEQGLRDIAGADRAFDPFAFMEGARGAYRMVLEAFWEGDKEDLRHLCDDEVYESFARAIDARSEAGETMENSLVRIEETSIVDAELDGREERITVRFRSDIAAVTRDAEGNVVAGSLDDAIEAVDIWTFARDASSPNPDWLLVETDEG